MLHKTIAFVITFGTLLMVRIPRPEQSEHSAAPSASWWRQAGYGWQYLRRRRVLRRGHGCGARHPDGTRRDGRARTRDGRDSLGPDRATLGSPSI